MLNNHLLPNGEEQYFPRIRFHEFKDDLGWKVRPFKSLFTFKTTNSFSREFLNYKSGNIKNIHYGDIHTKFSTLFNIELEEVPYVNANVNLDKISPDNYCQVGDVIFADASEDLKDVGKHIEIINLNNEKVISGTHTLLARKIDNSLITGFSSYLFSSRYLRQQIQKESQGTKVLGISAGRLSGIKIYLPTSADEQRKIADFLSSLDKLIESASFKLKLYKEHRTGLLQQLFPKNGENLPKLRLGKFSQEWKDIKLSEIAKPVKKKNSTGDEIKVLSLSNEHGLVSQADYFLKKVAGDNTERYIVLKKNDFVYNDRITKNSTYGTIKRLSLYESGIVSPIYKCFRFEKNQNPVFWEYFFESKTHESEIKQIVNEGARAGRYNISIDKFLSINVMQPSSTEQEKIASCLTSLDRLISNQTNYIEQLKKHKTGLMQQLFPVVEEI
ncbi:restriction endonuclease subunit S [Acinetobacter schindleri]|uniref:Type I restriction enzyme S subunit n=1 Tax=Acinetobacter lwoffii TaxID=28090 RepID=A0AAW8LNF4_ACILW|nr:restriction endonuclease subunit S [Acinetobacter lwoffii]MDR6630309.1 type I restriction enzyme S subunit [Acinetobacter lwoffii]